MYGRVRASVTFRFSKNARTRPYMYGRLFYDYDFKILGMPGLARKHPYVYGRMYGCFMVIEACLSRL